MAINLSGFNFFMPLFSFFFVFIVVYALFAKTKLLSESKFVHLLISFIMSIVFMSFSSMELYIRTILPWFVVLFIVAFLVLTVAAFSTKDWDKIMSPVFAWIFVAVLVIIFLIAAIKVFNPVFHPDLVVSGGDGSSGIAGQLKAFFIQSKVAGSVLLIITAVLVSWIITKK
ncbi:hypothetical protein GOV14_00855 [Candidatus Pacearchaeota archaeon]|nr:hypothetical protein [Candidatus Pacearchaeota archaeon]